MQLLAPTQAQAVSRHQRVLQATREKELNEVIENKRIELAKLEEDFQKLLASQRIRWGKEEKEHEKWVEERRAEIERLNEELKKAQFPADLLILRAKKILDEALTREHAVIKKQQENDVLEEILAQKIDEADEKKTAYEKRRVSLNSREQGIAAQEELTKQRTKTFSEYMASVEAGFDKTRQEFHKQYEKNQKILIDIEMGRKFINDKMEEIANRENQLRILELQYSSPLNNISPIKQ